MKASELRIGNYVFHKENVLRITNIIDFCVNMEFGEQSGERNDEIDIDEISPIPLTEELLKKCGFDVHPYDDNSGNGKTAELEYLIKTKNTPEGYCQSFSMDKGNNWEHWTYNHSGGDYEINAVNIKIKSLHQLQNLYFALTGEELKIDL